MLEETPVDPVDGVIPCIAVIDEDSEFNNCNGCSNQATMWNRFRARYPHRPFCLLIVEGSLNSLIPPSNFQSDSNAVFHYNIIRDNGDMNLADDWRLLCGLDSYTSEEIPSVGLFVDNSGSMTKSEVQASYEKFFNDMAGQGIHVKEVVNTQENWILPFMTILIK